MKKIRVRNNSIKVKAGLAQSSDCPTITEIDGGAANMTPQPINGTLEGGTN